MTDVAAYRLALERIAATARLATFEELGVALPPVTVDLRLVPPGAERLCTDYADTVTLAVSDVRQLRPPPDGGNTIYGTCHEIGHLALSRVAPEELPVVWDEAFAHLLAVDLYLPAVWSALGDDVWPDPYPDDLRREGALRAGGGGHFGGYESSLARLTAQLRSLARVTGTRGLLAALAGLPPDALRATTLGPALRRAVDGHGTQRHTV